MIHTHGTTNGKGVSFEYGRGLTITLLDREMKDDDSRYKVEVRDSKDVVVSTTVMNRDVKESGDDLVSISVRPFPVLVRP